MKRFASVMSWLILAVAGFVFLATVSGHWHPPQALAPIAGTPQNSLPPPGDVTDGFPTGRPRWIEFDIDDPLLEDLSSREQADQGRDWLLWTIASEEVRTSEQLSRTLFDTPAIRHGYLRQVTHFDYGRTRSCLLESGDVLALVPKSDADQRADDLAHIADEQRKNLGRIPENVRVFEYEINGLKSATVTQIESIPGAKFYSPDYGYREASIADSGDLANFMRETDDLVTAKVVSRGVRLGGRKNRTGSRNVRPAEVAAVWQAEADIQKNLQAQKAKIDGFNLTWQRKLDDFNASWRGREASYSTKYEHDRAWSDFQSRHDRAQKDFEEKLIAESKNLHLVNGSGFSLDPSYDYAGLSKALAVLGDKSVEGLPVNRLRPIVAALQAPVPDIVPLLEFIDELENARDGNAVLGRILAEALHALEQQHRFQAARYDGPLKGTEAGMVLFYTDLIAKLWALDFQRSTPSGVIASFEPMTRVAVSPAYEAEMIKLPSTRLWFGPEDTGYEVASRDELLFARNATRIYAASSNPLKPGKEVAPNAQSEAFLGWWNDHYEEVARYESEYQRLNEIMKWSLLIGWLNEAGRGGLLGFLEGVEVDRSAWFPAWVKRSPQLRFTAWDKVRFFPKGHLQTQTEAMPILMSEPYALLGLSDVAGKTHVLGGGVSLASKDIFKARVSVPGEMPSVLRRSGLNYSKVSSSTGELVTMRGARFKFSSRATGTSAAGSGASRFQPAIVRMEGPEGAKFRSRFGDIGTGKFTRTVRQTEGSTMVKLETAGADIGALDLSRSKNGYRLAWRAREVDDGFTLARKLSNAPDPATVLKNDPTVQFALQDPNTGEFFVQSVGSRSWLKLAPETQPLPDLAEGWSARVADLKPDAKTYQLKWIESGDLPEQVRASGPWTRGPPPPPKGPGPAGGTASSAEFPWNDGRAMGRIANDIAKDPAGWKRAQNQRLRETLHDLDDLSRRRPQRAEDQIREAIARHGEHPELLLREAVAELGSAKLEAAAEAMNRARPKSPEYFDDLLGEINVRLKAATGPIRSDLHTCAESLEWKASGKLRSRDEVRVVADADGLALEARLANVSEGSPVTNPAEFRNAQIYHEDTPSLNNLDWSKAPQAALDYVHSHDLGTVIKLPRSDIAHYRPKTISVADQSRHYRAAGATSAPKSAARAMRTSFRAWSPSGVGGDEDDEDETREKDFVYLVTATVAAGQAAR